MKTILIPVFKQRISTRLDCSEYFQIIKIVNNIIQSTVTIKIVAQNQLELLNEILSMKPDTIICNGVTLFFVSEFLNNHIELISSVYGLVDEILKDFLEGKALAKTI